jgi:putative ABC transport system permease protein
MYSNYLKIAFRNLWKNKLFSFINIVGLGLAIPFSLLSFLHLQSSFEFDNFHPDSDRIYRITTNEKTSDGTISRYASSPFFLSDHLKKEYPSIEITTKTIRDFGWELSNRLKSLKANTIYVEPSFFQIFGFYIEKGDLPIEPNSLVLSHEMAEKFYGETNPVGKTLVHPTYGNFKITGVLKPYKKQTQFRSDVMVSMSTYENKVKNSPQALAWDKYESFTYVKLIPKANINSLELAIKDVAKKTNPFLEASKKTNEFRIQSINDISPSIEKLKYNPYVEDMLDISFNFAVPLLILLLAGFNYTNLTLARSLSRAKEVGVRKVMGAFRKQLIFQFVCEAIIVSFFSLLLGVILLQIMRETLHVNWLTWEVDNQVYIWITFFIFSLFLGILAGILPAWILSGFQPVTVLKGTLSPASFGKINFRKSLMVIQFAVSMIFIFWIGHFYNQFEYMATENDNFNRKGIFNISMVDNKFGLLKDEISKNKNVVSIGLTSIPFGGVTAENGLKSNVNEENIATYYYAADHQYIENMQLKFVAGQNIPPTQSDSAGNFVVINEKAVEKLRLGTPKEAIGKAVFLDNSNQLTVSGVVQNFCHFNYQFDIEPLVFQYNPSHFHVLSVKVNNDVSKTEFLEEMKTVWNKQYPYDPLVGVWLDSELYDRYYPAEDMKIMGVASMVILTIAIMGLLGMITFSTEKRMKEIGIRKVMGASIFSIIKELSMSYTKLIIIAGIIALPIGYVSGVIFQSIFTFHSNVNIGLMLAFFTSISLFAIFTIGYFSLKASLMNPVKSLRSE